MDVEIRSADAIPPEALRAFVVAAWHSEVVVAHGERIEPLAWPGMVAMRGDALVGHVAYRVGDDEWELVAIAAHPPGQGIGGRLLDAVVRRARASGAARLRLTTTNDNLEALRLYQRRGFRLFRLRAGEVDEARRTLKPELPTIGAHGIPMRDELDLELHLG